MLKNFIIFSISFYSSFLFSTLAESSECVKASLNDCHLKNGDQITCANEKVYELKKQKLFDYFKAGPSSLWGRNLFCLGKTTEQKEETNVDFSHFCVDENNQRVGQVIFYNKIGAARGEKQMVEYGSRGKFKNNQLDPESIDYETKGGKKVKRLGVLYHLPTYDPNLIEIRAKLKKQYENCNKNFLSYCDVSPKEMVIDCFDGYKTKVFELVVSSKTGKRLTIPPVKDPNQRSENQSFENVSEK